MKQRVLLFFIVFVSTIVGFLVTPYNKGFSGDYSWWFKMLPDAAAIALLNVVVFYVSGFPVSPIKNRKFDDLFGFLIVSCVASVISMFAYMLISNRGYGRYVLFTSWALLNILHWWWYAFQSKKGRGAVLLIVGDVSCLDLKLIENVYPQIIRIGANISDIVIEEIVERIRIDTGEVCIVDFSGTLFQEYRLMLFLNQKINVNIFSESEFFEKVLGMVKFKANDKMWLYSAIQRRKTHVDVKRCFDLIIAFLGLAAAIPVCTLVYLVGRIFDRGPFFYRQQRLGLSGEEFTIYKIRTMRVDAEKDGAVWAKVRDERVTRFGAILRRTRIDEIPQFYNILKGDMSFIGPRPERAELVEKISRESKEFVLRCLYKPGLTGWAQVNFRYGSSVDDSICKLAYDMYYIKNWSLVLDVNIVFRTVLAMVKGAQ